MISGHLVDKTVLDGRFIWKREANCCHDYTKFHNEGESKYPVCNQPSCSQAEWKVRVSMSDVLKMF